MGKTSKTLHSKKPRDKRGKKKPASLGKCEKKPKLFKQKTLSTASRSKITERRKSNCENFTIFRRKQLILMYHTKSLNAILASKGLKRVSVEGDGNCFFNCIKKICGLQEEVLDVRQKICDHISESESEYINFVKQEPETVIKVSKEELYRSQLENLRKSESWPSDLRDALTMAASNAYQKKILIYSSKSQKPIIQVQPSISHHSVHDEIILAYTAAAGYEHYDICEPIGNDQTSSIKKEHSVCTIKRKNENKSVAVTLHKQAKSTSSKRQRSANPQNWKKNIRKYSRLAGKEYVSTLGKTIPAKKLLQASCLKCRYHCSQNISDVERQRLFDSYWSLRSYEGKQDFLCKNITEAKPERVRTSAKLHRSTSRSFFFTLNDRQVRVCKTFFMKTLNIGSSCINSALRNKLGSTSKDKRGRHTPHNATPKAVIDKIKEHIESFPLMDPHYVKSDTHKKFLGRELSVKKMYALYKENCELEDREAVGPSVYRKVFYENYNFSFLQPKIDQCETCTFYSKEEQKGSVTDQVRQDYNNHLECKINMIEEKNVDKKIAATHKNYHVATFDFDEVLPIPCSHVNQVYYKRKLCCFNLSLYSLGCSKGTCFLWNETEGKMGSNEIGTCLLTYLKGLPSAINHVCFFSDSRPENRNRFIVTAFLHAVATLPNINVIDHKFLESGHTQTECDSMHAAIGRAKKNTPIFVPSQYDTIVRMARTKNKYAVVPLKYQDFYDFKPICTEILPVTLVDSKGTEVRWSNLRWIQFRKSDLTSIFFKYNVKDETFSSFSVRKPSTEKSISEPMQACYKAKLPISLAKKNDLVSLCKSGVIPVEFHHYYENLFCDVNLKDHLAELDVAEEYDDEVMSD